MGDLSYRPIIDDFTWSYSRVTSFDDCPYKFFMRYIKGMHEDDMFYASYGTFMHKLIEEICNKKLNNDQAKLKFLANFSKEVKGKRPPGDIAVNYIKKGVDFLSTFNGFDGFNTVAVEKYFEFDVDGIKMCGIIDYLGEKDGEYYIIDNKSRDLKPRSTRKKPTQKDEELDSMLKQLYIYSAAVKQTYGKFPKGLCFNCFKNKTFIQEEFNIDKYNEAVAWLKSTIEYIKNADDFYPNIEFFRCRYLCGLQNECCYFENT